MHDEYCRSRNTHIANRLPINCKMSGPKAARSVAAIGGGMAEDLNAGQTWGLGPSGTPGLQDECYVL